MSMSTTQKQLKFSNSVSATCMEEKRKPINKKDKKYTSLKCVNYEIK